MSELKFKKIPSSIRQLQRPWFPNHTNPRIEGMIRMGARLGERYPDRAPIIRHWLSGGNGTCFENPEDTNPEIISAFRELSKGQYLPVVDSRLSELARSELELFLAGRGVNLVGDRGGPAALINHEVTSNLIEILSLLPESHFGHAHFTRLKLGGWGSGAAKGSEFKDPEVRIFTFATQGPVRNLYAITLHEIGHSFAATLPDAYIEALEKARLRLCRTGKIFGMDYLHGAGERRSHILSSLREFIAETYLMYVTQGAFTKEGLSFLGSSDAVDGRPSYFYHYLEHLAPDERRVLTAIWGLYRKKFEGIEYV